MPGVLIIEALAQVGCVCVLSDEKFAGKTAYFGGINKARFRGKVVPGDVLTLKIEVVKAKGPIGICEAKAYVEDKLVVEAELTVAIA